MFAVPPTPGVFVAKMSNKKSKKKKQKKDRKRSSTSSHEGDDKSSHEKKYRKSGESSEGKDSRTYLVRFMQDEEKGTRQTDPLPSPKGPECSPREDRPYKKPVYRLGTVTPSEKEKDHLQEVKEKHLKSDTASILENASKRPHCSGKSSVRLASAGGSAATHLSEELRELRRQLVKRRSREAFASESNSYVRPSLGKDSVEDSPEPKKQAAAFEKTTASCSSSNVSTAISKGPSTLSETPKPSGSGQEEKLRSKPGTFLCFKIPKKTNVVVNRNEFWERSSFRDDKGSTAQKLPHKSVSRQSPQAENMVSGCTFSDKKSIKEEARQSCEIIPTASHFIKASPPPSQRNQEALKSCPGTEKGRERASNAAVFSETTQSPRVSSETTETCDNGQEMQLMEELHLARSQRLLEVNVVDSYGELTRMDIDPPEEITTFSFSAEHIHRDSLIILDTNILLSHLDFVKKMRSHGLGALGFPNILIPWVVMQELDALKDGKLSSSVKHKAKPAVHYIYNTLKKQEPRLWGQSMQQAARRIYGLNAENNDDRVLQCCLQYQSLHPGVALILCTNDKNLCSKALLSGVKALSKADLVSEVEQLQCDTQAHSRQVFPVGWPPQTAEDGNGNKVNAGSQATEEACDVSTSVSVLEEALQGALSRVLEAEMKTAFDSLWLEVVFVKPPWTLSDLLLCFKKHWIAVFGSIVQRSLRNSVEYLSDSLCKGKTVDKHSAKLVVQEARELLLAFSCRSDYGGSLTKALSALDLLLQDAPQLNRSAEQTPGDRGLASSDGDVLMAGEEGVTDTQPLYQEVWAVFENIWSNMCQISSAVFTALQFIPGTLEISMPSDGPPPPEDALSCLHKLTAAVRQLLESLQRVLSSKSCFEDMQALLAFINTSEMATMKPQFTAKDLFECLSQQEYREKLRVGGSQLVDLSLSLDRCASAVSQRAGSSSWS
ncbi:hypothetical protein AAFF_G00204260 [Aldrovandia affinis]|uniref:Transcriptional protein SWT1 n=1 Tax=Aldrovandia affinis TaxID=143900 RepID=A0AAD7RHU4_9TELE|nr:hypothetical protein AAFF_G00204260 [Aldrovandia affinis]